MTELARLLDPKALDASPGRRGVVKIVAPAAWLEAGAELEVVVPRTVPCARCDGGGCDACDKSGALKLPAEPASRTLRTRLPAHAPDAFVLRLVDPFGPSGGLSQLMLEIREGDAPSPGCTRVDRPARVAPPSAGAGGDPWMRAAMMALALAAALAALLGATSRP